jgi:hypothetical protein
MKRAPGNEPSLSKLLLDGEARISALGMLSSTGLDAQEGNVIHQRRWAFCVTESSIWPNAEEGLGEFLHYAKS